MRPLARRIMLALVGSALLLADAASMSRAAGSVAYTYDALGRIVTATYSNGAVITYIYDAAGNRTQQTTTGGSSYPSLTWTSSSTCPTNCWGTSSW